MKTILTFFAGFALPILGLSQIQCVVDVTISEGETISFCENDPLTITASDGYTSYNWTGPETLTGQSITPSFSGQYIVAATDGVGCVSNDTIIVTIFPIPVDDIQSSEGTVICPGGGGTVLSLNSSHNSYSWSTGATSPTILVSTAGSYSVDFMDENGCTGNATIELTEVNFNLASTANSVCVGGSTTLTASGGDSYVWTTGEGGNSIVVDPESTTTYGVTISSGNCTQTLSVSVEPGEEFEFALDDTVYLDANQSWNLYGPAGYQSYSWTPASVVSPSDAANPVFIGDSSTLVIMTATHPDGCELVDSTMFIVVNLSIPNGISPNGDGLNDFFVIPELGAYPAKLTVWNRWGDKVYHSDYYLNNWGGTCEGALCLGSGTLPEGTYYYLIDVQGIIYKGYITLKL